eukprot:tig00000865_g5105.t1
MNVKWSALVDAGKAAVKSTIENAAGKVAEKVADTHPHDVLSVELGVKGPPGALAPGEELLARVRLISNRYSLVVSNESSLGNQSLALKVCVFSEDDFASRRPPFFQREFADVSTLFHPLGVSRVEALFSVPAERAPAVLDAVLLNKGQADACKAAFKLRAAHDPCGCFVLDCRAVLGGALYLQDALDRPLPPAASPATPPPPFGPGGDLGDEEGPAPVAGPSGAAGEAAGQEAAAKEEQEEERRAGAHERIGELMGQYASARGAGARADLLHRLVAVVEGVLADAPGPGATLAPEAAVEREADLAAVGAARALGEPLDEPARLARPAATAARARAALTARRRRCGVAGGERGAGELCRVLPDVESLVAAAAGLVVAGLRGYGCACAEHPDACACTWAPAVALGRLASLVEADVGRSVGELDLATRLLAMRVAQLARALRAASRGAARLDAAALCAPLLEQWHEQQEAAYARGVEEALEGEEWRPVRGGALEAARVARSAVQVGELVDGGAEELATLELPLGEQDLLRAATGIHLLIREYAAAVTCSGLPPAAQEFGSWRRPERLAAAVAEVREDFAALRGDLQRALGRVAARTLAAASALSAAPQASPTATRAASPAPTRSPAPGPPRQGQPLPRRRLLPGPPPPLPAPPGPRPRPAAASPRGALRELCVRVSSLVYLRDVPSPAPATASPPPPPTPTPSGPPPRRPAPPSPPRTPDRPATSRTPRASRSPGPPVQGRRGGRAPAGPPPTAAARRPRRPGGRSAPDTPEGGAAPPGLLQALFDLSAGTQQAIERGVDALTDRLVSGAVRLAMHEPLVASVEGGVAPAGQPGVAAWLVDRLEDLDALVREAAGEAARARLSRALLRACAGHLERLVEERAGRAGGAAGRALGDIAVLEKFWRQAGLEREAVEAFFAPSRALLSAAARSR